MEQPSIWNLKSRSLIVKRNPISGLFLPPPSSAAPAEPPSDPGRITLVQSKGTRLRGTPNDLPSTHKVLMAHCGIACSLYVTEHLPMLAVDHNGQFQTFEESDFSSALAWLKALHYMSSSGPVTNIARHRIYSEADAPEQYDISWAYQTGLIDSPKARSAVQRNQGNFEEGKMPCWLGHNAILQELGMHLTYTLVDDDDKEVAKANISSCAFGAKMGSCLLTFKKAW